MATKAFNGWLDWQLKHGSHDFPGPDGGTCINEAAVVVAGFIYREVTSIADLPESFCPVIGQYALTLNDAMPEGEPLNRLRPFAARLAGSSGGRKTASLRSSYLAMRAARDFVPLALKAADLKAASQLKSAGNCEEMLVLLESLIERGWPDNVGEAIGAAQRALSRAQRGADPIYTAELAAICATRAAAIDVRAWDVAIDALDGALLEGKQADPIETELIEQRAADVLALS